MRPPAGPDQTFSNRTKIVLVSIVLALLLFAFGILIGLVIRQARQQERVPQQTSAVPAIVIPTPNCGTPALVLGSSTLRIETIRPAADGSLSLPSDTAGVAYWVEGTDKNYVFLLGSAPENLALQATLENEVLVTIIWADCSTVSFSVSTKESAQLADPALLDQSAEGIAVFVQTEPATAGFVIRGSLLEETVSVPGTPGPDESGILAEISLLETTTSPDGTIEVSISILNYGQTAFSLMSQDVSLTPENAAPLAMIGSEPSLPKRIDPSSTETFVFTFPLPSAQVATFKIFTVEYDIEGY